MICRYTHTHINFHVVAKVNMNNPIKNFFAVQKEKKLTLLKVKPNKVLIIDFNTTFLLSL